MSQELDNRIDALKQRLISTAATPITMGNYKQQLRTYQEMMLELIKIVDEVNTQSDTISPAELQQIRTALTAAIEKGET